MMAPLAAVRTSSDEHGLVYAFAAVGIDYFGTLFVKLGPRTRSKNPALAKRCGCTFTCLRYRAVHIGYLRTCRQIILSVQSYVLSVEEVRLALYRATTALTSRALNWK